MRKPTVHIVIRNGIVEEAYAEGCNPDVVVYDLDCPPGDMRRRKSCCTTRLCSEIPFIKQELVCFKQTLEKAKENNIEAYRLVASSEVADYLENNELEVSDYEFEQICNFVYDWIIHTDAQPYEVVNALVSIIQESDYYKFADIHCDWNELTKRS